MLCELKGIKRKKKNARSRTGIYRYVEMVMGDTVRMKIELKGLRDFFFFSTPHLPASTVKKVVDC